MSSQPFLGGTLSVILTDGRSISITGLLAARICADRFERVVIIEADEGADAYFPATADSRKDIHGNLSYVSRRPRVAQTFGVHCEQANVFSVLSL